MNGISPAAHAGEAEAPTVGRVFVAALARGARALPPSAAEAAARAIGGARRALRPGEVATVRRNLQRLGLDASRRGDDNFRAFGLFAVELFRGLRMEPARIAAGWEIDNHERFARLARDPRGFILAGAHTGNWEQLAALAAVAGRQIVAPAATQFHPLVSPAVATWKRAHGVRTIAPWASPRLLASALDEGALIGLPLDGGSFRRGRVVRLRGTRLRLAEGAVRRALLSGRPILPVFGLRTGFMRQRVRIHPPLAAADFAGSPGDRLDALAQALADLLGEHLGSAARQWCIFRPLAWYDQQSTTPATEEKTHAPVAAPS